MRAASTIALIAAVVLAAPAGSAAAEPADSPARTVTVEGTGIVTALPDTAKVQVGVETTSASPDVALAENIRAAKVLFAMFEEFGIRGADIQTTALVVSPVYDHRPQEARAPAPQGYRVHNSLSVRLRDLSRLGEFLTTLVEAGANRLDGVTFEIGDDASMRERARRAAVVDARARAELYAAAAEVKLGRVLSISEVRDAGPRPTGMVAMRAEAVPTAPGEQTVSATVRMVFAIE